jgi:hypothetical protein
MLESFICSRARRLAMSVTCCYSTGYTQSNDAAENDWTLFSW